MNSRYQQQIKLIIFNFQSLMPNMDSFIFSPMKKNDYPLLPPGGSMGP